MPDHAVAPASTSSFSATMTFSPWKAAVTATDRSPAARTRKREAEKMRLQNRVERAAPAKAGRNGRLAANTQTRWLNASKTEPKTYLIRESTRDPVEWSENIDRGEKFTSAQGARDRAKRAGLKTDTDTFEVIEIPVRNLSSGFNRWQPKSPCRCRRTQDKAVCGPANGIRPGRSPCKRGNQY